MENKIQKAETIDRLKNLIRNSGEGFFKKITRGEKTLYVAYTNVNGFLSLLINGHGKTYAFIKESLTDEDRAKELNILFDDKELHYFSKNELKQMEELAEQQKLGNNVIENITPGDIKNLVEKCQMTFDEINAGYVFINIIDKFNKYKSGTEWNNACNMAYVFRLGIIQGKREERARRKASLIVGGTN